MSISPELTVPYKSKSADVTKNNAASTATSLLTYFLKKRKQKIPRTTKESSEGSLTTHSSMLPKMKNVPAIIQLKTGGLL